MWTHKDNFQALRQKGIALLHRASVLSGRAAAGCPMDEAMWDDITATCRATLAFARGLPDFRLPEYDVHNPDAIGSILAIAHAAAYSAVIQVHGIVALAQPLAREEQLKAAKRAMVIVKEMSTARPSYIPHFFGWALAPIHKFLLREKMQLEELHHEAGAAAVQSDLNALSHTLRRVGELYPIPASVLAEMLDRNVETLKLEMVGKQMNLSGGP
ncbi:hypothetical protein BOTBODRAFT_60998 [Botryobasidium botryosum FD-172 SS1]|uniref:Uncharacterized protein n=1 Tax=Botryobasidium botryosum (strain FD-172 SS1) TaxID=930990 RepID=A0A067NAW2_BOTB1|nr:hypothetical protein BOTBODRAFT_60998 [Botryobasidium botryosum FD-172 SS1]